MIGVIDYKAGNAPSVLNALQILKIPSSLVSSPADIEKSMGLILPGVGSAKATMESLKEMGCLETIEKKVLREGIPFLGICIGLEVLFEHSEEGDTAAWLACRHGKKISGKFCSRAAEAERNKVCKKPSGLIA